MSSPAEIPRADEALKSLVAQFKAAPDSSAFIELAQAMLARGHAAEALRIVEHGLQHSPRNVEGRVERSAALLALGRPRVAYVELVRALAIVPEHRRAMRLLGRAFKDAGAPGRAAQLLARRSTRQPEEDNVTEVQAAPTRKRLLPPSLDTVPNAAAPIPKPPAPSAPIGGDIPNLFSSLTKDLGLGAAQPTGVPNRVEVTQVIRRRALPRPPRSASELAAIDGPIIDKTQPGQLEIDTGDLAPVASAEPRPLFEGKTDQFAAASFGADDEPLFEDDMPFEVRPVHTESGDLGDPSAAGGRTSVDFVTEHGDTLVEHLEETDRGDDGDLAPPSTVPLNDEPLPFASPADVVRFDGQGPPLIERHRSPKSATEDLVPHLEVEVPAAKPQHIILGICAAFAIAIYGIVLVGSSLDAMQAWLPKPVAEVMGSVFGTPEEGKGSPADTAGAAPADPSESRAAK